MHCYHIHAPHYNITPLQLNRVLDLSRHKHAFTQLRLAAISQKSGVSAAPSSSAPSNHPADAVKGSEPPPPHNLELLYALPPAMLSSHAFI
jgi:hypothetical protein